MPTFKVGERVELHNSHSGIGKGGTVVGKEIIYHVREDGGYTFTRRPDELIKLPKAGKEEL